MANNTTKFCRHQHSPQHSKQTQKRSPKNDNNNREIQVPLPHTHIQKEKQQIKYDFSFNKMFTFCQKVFRINFISFGNTQLCVHCTDITTPYNIHYNSRMYIYELFH